MLLISLTLYQICLLEFIRVEGGVRFMKHFKGGAIKVWKTVHYPKINLNVTHASLLIFK
jgi:hypothetical protein